MFHYAAFALTLVSGILLVPLYLRFLSVETYGAWLAAANILGWLSLMDPGLSGALAQRAGAAYGDQDREQVGALFLGGLCISGVVALTVATAGWFAADHVPGWVRLTDPQQRYALALAFKFAAVGTGFLVLSYAVTATNMGLQSSIGIGTIFLSVNALAIVAIVVGLWTGWGVVALALGILVRGIGLTVGNLGYLAWRCRIERGFRFSRPALRELASLTAWTALGRIGGVLSTSVDAFVVARVLGPEAVPILLLTRRAPETARMLLERPSVALMPSVAHVRGSGEIQKAGDILPRLFKAQVWASGLFLAGFAALNDDFVRLWVGQQFYAGALANAGICIWLTLAALLVSLSNVCFAFGNIRGNGLVELAQGLVFLVVVVVATAEAGIVGAALAPIVPLILVSAWYFPRRFRQLLGLSRAHLTGTLREAGRAVFAGVVAIAVFGMVHPSGWIEFGVTVLGVALLYLLTLWVVSPILRTEFVPLARRILG